MSAVIKEAVTFTGRMGRRKYTPAADGQKARLNVSVYSRDSWTGGDGERHEGPWETVDVTYWGRSAEQLDEAFRGGAMPDKSWVIGTGYLSPAPRTWIEDGEAKGHIQLDGRSLGPETIMESYRQQAIGRDRQRGGRDHSPASPQAAPQDQAAPSFPPAGVREPDWAQAQPTD